MTHRSSILLLLLGLPLTVFLGMNVGSWDMGPDEVWAAIWGPENLQKAIVRDLRLSRVLLAMCSGALLTLGGFLMQALVRNPLADPYIMGLSAGAGLGANLRLLGIISLGSIAFLPFYAFAGAALSLGLLLVLGRRSLQEDSSRLLIAGIAVSSFFVAITGFLIYTANDFEDLRSVIYWSLGGFGGAKWQAVAVSVGLLAILWAYAWWMRNSLDVLALGDVQAGALGMGVRKIKLSLLLMTALCVGGSIAYTGPIGFVGLMIPHFSRGINGGLHRDNLIFGPLLGAVFLPLCDLTSQLLYPPAGLPVGILTAMLGVPFFLHLLFSSRHRI
jgi:iron complex transport system permease protein